MSGVRSADKAAVDTRRTPPRTPAALMRRIAPTPEEVLPTAPRQRASVRRKRNTRWLATSTLLSARSRNARRRRSVRGWRRRRGRERVLRRAKTTTADGGAKEGEVGPSMRALDSCCQGRIGRTRIGASPPARADAAALLQRMAEPGRSTLVRGHRLNRPTPTTWGTSRTQGRHCGPAAAHHVHVLTTSAMAPARDAGAQEALTGISYASPTCARSTSAGWGCGTTRSKRSTPRRSRTWWSYSWHGARAWVYPGGVRAARSRARPLQHRARVAGPRPGRYSIDNPAGAHQKSFSPCDARATVHGLTPHGHQARRLQR